jgi:putative chitinase
MVTVDQLQQIFPHGDANDIGQICDPLNAAMDEFGINSAMQQAMFIAQCGHESGVFSIAEENLNYSAKGLLATFPRYFQQQNANNYARQPEKIGNYVYGNRMGNGNPSTGDGFRYRGRGLIQLTGKDNYTACGTALGVDLVSDPSYLTQPEGAARSAAWFWSSHNLNRYADADDIVGSTRRINGGTIGLSERQTYYNAAKSVLC